MPILIDRATALEDQVRRLNEGDDYLVKPFAMPELSARVRKALIAAASPNAQSVISLNSLGDGPGAG